MARRCEEASILQGAHAWCGTQGWLAALLTGTMIHSSEACHHSPAPSLCTHHSRVFATCLSLLSARKRTLTAPNTHTIHTLSHKCQTCIYMGSHSKTTSTNSLGSDNSSLSRKASRPWSSKNVTSYLEPPLFGLEWLRGTSETIASAVVSSSSRTSTRLPSVADPPHPPPASGKAFSEV